VAEQQPEPAGVGGGRADQRRDGLVAVVAGADRLGQRGAGAVQDGPVQVGLGLEVPVEDYPGDPGLGRDVVQAGRGEPGAGEGAGGSGEDLLAPLGPAQPARRLGCTRCTHRRPAPLLFTREYTYSLVYAEVYN